MDIYVLLAFGIGLLFWGMIVFFKRANLYKKGERLEGEIIEIREIEEPILQTFNYEEKVVLHKPVVKINYKEKDIVFFFDEEIDIKKYSIGDFLKIIYDEKEKDVFLDSKIDFFKFPIFLILLSILFFSVTIGLFLIK